MESSASTFRILTWTFGVLGNTFGVIRGTFVILARTFGGLGGLLFLNGKARLESLVGWLKALIFINSPFVNKYWSKSTSIISARVYPCVNEACAPYPSTSVESVLCSLSRN